MTTAAILLAAGGGTRMATPVPKAFLELGEQPMFVHSLMAMAESGVLDVVVLVVPRARLGEAAMAVDALELEGITPIAVVAGGASRQESVERGLAEAPAGATRIVCHDAARPFASPGLFRAVVDALGAHPTAADPPDGVVPVVPSPDTIKRIRGGVVVETIPRQEIGLVQTPQGFDAGALRRAHARALARGDKAATDDAVLLEEAGFRVIAVPGEPGNFKITTSEDLRRADHLPVRRHAPRPDGALPARG